MGKVLHLFVFASFLLEASSSHSTCRDHVTPTELLPFSVSDIVISPKFPTTADSFEVNFIATAQQQVFNPVAKFSFYVFDILIEEKEVSLCSDQRSSMFSKFAEAASHESDFHGVRCPLSIGHTIEATFRHQLASEVPEGIEGIVRIELADETSSKTDIRTCVEDSLVVKDSPDVLSARFGFEDREVDFLFEKWYKQHQNSIFLPRGSHSFDFLLDNSPAFEHLRSRKPIFKQNLMKIAQHNAQKSKTWKLGMNHFGHLSAEEFKTIYASGLRNDLSVRYSAKSTDYSVARKLNSETSFSLRSYQALNLRNELPSEVNWVTNGAVTPVKNQGACGSCWSFASTGALEGAYFVKYKKLVSFSEQELVSCDHVDMGCNGGAMDNAFNFISAGHGLCTEESYPYTAGQGVRGFCNNTCSPVANSAPSSVVDVQHDETSLMEAVAKQPVAVAIEADEEAFQFYSSGVLTAPCSQKLDHGVLVVGYGTEDGVDYWLVKNSWGPMWGLEGYIKLVRGAEQEDGGECGILLGPSYPVL